MEELHSIHSAAHRFALREDVAHKDAIIRQMGSKVELQSSEEKKMEQELRRLNIQV
jgi:hypothetical protein